ncbi:5-oxoprolinase subunit C family protein [Granulicatella seriolae]|uniref:Biotin-dependent carboxyltransferase family protein n=1 Tax=Granulicatella seriolae TaxID=2967226 RepID=A0ABT1WN11_9LACT|nr:biotin-dependent carboxyltransferase family protein [Granulicatella seriolae]
MGIRILKAGLQTSIQDMGRMGYQSQGFGVSGVMDQRSFRLANLLLDNPENEAVIEFSLIGPTLEFTADAIISITGADYQPLVNKEAVPMYTAIYMKSGDVLEFQGSRAGTWAYIAFSCYLDIPVVMGSRSTNVRCSIGGFKGRKLQENDFIGFRIKRRYLPYFLSRNLDLDEFNQEEELIRVVAGPQDKYFTKEGKNTFYGKAYTISGNCDRMGCRLDGPYIAHKGSADIISDGIALGAIQVPAHGNPIILLADRQTTGGYPKIATVASVDLPKLVQRKVDHQVRFQAIGVEEAQNLLRAELREFAQFRKQIHQPCPEVLDVRLVAKQLATLFKDES